MLCKNCCTAGGQPGNQAISNVPKWATSSCPWGCAPYFVTETAKRCAHASRMPPCCSSPWAASISCFVDLLFTTSGAKAAAAWLLVSKSGRIGWRYKACNGPAGSWAAARSPFNVLFCTFGVATLAKKSPAACLPVITGDPKHSCKAACTSITLCPFVISTVRSAMACRAALLVWAADARHRHAAALTHGGDVTQVANISKAGRLPLRSIAPSLMQASTRSRAVAMLLNRSWENSTLPEMSTWLSCWSTWCNIFS